MGRTNRLMLWVVICVLLVCLALYGVVTGLNKVNDEIAATQTQRAVYSGWDAEMHATMTAEAPGRRK